MLDEKRMINLQEKTKLLTGILEKTKYYIVGIPEMQRIVVFSYLH